MPAFITFGRILFAVLFIYTGATKLFGIPATAEFIAAKVTIPELLLPYAAQLQTLTGMPTAQTLAIAAGGFEVIAGLMIALNFGARFFSLLMIIFVGLVTYYFHDFWNQAGPERLDNMAHALKNLSIVGGLLVFFALGSWRPFSEREGEYYPRREEALREEPMPH